MRLLNTKRLELAEFQGNVPDYAILSHTWEEEEVVFKDLENKTYEHKAGWKKITKCCAVARGDGWHWVWIDTCCIDKSSSSELSEAINSMFNWYHDAQVCYAYLSDYSVPDQDSGTDSSLGRGMFHRSKWFKRGWTLQELIAPRMLWFVDKTWTFVGSRAVLANAVELATGISPRNMRKYRTCGVAQKFSWATGRETTRTEDLAYCLLGLFNINMPLLYGEGNKAFLRLQQEIIRSIDDESVFAWDHLVPYWHRMGVDSDFGPLLAPSPSSFGSSEQYDCVPLPSKIDDVKVGVQRLNRNKSTYTLTNAGLRIDADFLIPSKNLDSASNGDLIYWPLDYVPEHWTRQCMIPLRSTKSDSYRRIKHRNLGIGIGIGDDLTTSYLYQRKQILVIDYDEAERAKSQDGDQSFTLWLSTGSSIITSIKKIRPVHRRYVKDDENRKQISRVRPDSAHGTRLILTNAEALIFLSGMEHKNVLLYIGCLYNNAIGSNELSMYLMEYTPTDEPNDLKVEVLRQTCAIRANFQSAWLRNGDMTLTAEIRPIISRGRDQYSWEHEYKVSFQNRSLPSWYIPLQFAPQSYQKD